MPVEPVLSWRSFVPRTQTPLPSVLDAGPALFLTSARVGIALALRAHGIGPGHEVLVPAYHCIAMIEPVRFCGATPVFYRVTDNARADIGDIAAKCSARTRAIIAVHYFGFPQDMRSLRPLCDDRGLLFIEDCAHAFFGEMDGQPVGRHGDYAIASALKFFPIYDGGVLISARHNLSGIHLNSAGVSFEMKSIVNILEQSATYSRLRPLSMPLRATMAIKDRLWRAHKRRRPVPSGVPAPVAADGAYGFDPDSLDKRASHMSRLLTAIASRQRITQKRRDHYRALLAAFEGISGASPLYPDLPHGVVPYMFPLRLRNPDTVYYSLKREGVPVLRFSEDHWPGVDESVCPAAARLAHEVIQIPCHQELRARELNWIIDRVRTTIAAH